MYGNREREREKDRKKECVSLFASDFIRFTENEQKFNVFFHSSVANEFLY